MITGNNFNNDYPNTNAAKQDTVYFSTNRSKIDTKNLLDSYNTESGSGKLGAALGGLYEKNSWDTHNRNVHWDTKDSLSTKLKCKLKWYSWLKYSGKFDSYYDYKRYFINNKK